MAKYERKRDEKERCYNCDYFSRMWNFCGCPDSRACINAELVGEWERCEHWKEREADNG